MCAPRRAARTLRHRPRKRFVIVSAALLLPAREPFSKTLFCRRASAREADANVNGAIDMPVRGYFISDCRFSGIFIGMIPPDAIETFAHFLLSEGRFRTVLRADERFKSEFINYFSCIIFFIIFLL